MPPSGLSAAQEALLSAACHCSARTGGASLAGIEGAAQGAGSNAAVEVVAAAEVGVGKPAVVETSGVVVEPVEGPQATAMSNRVDPIQARRFTRPLYFVSH